MFIWSYILVGIAALFNAFMDTVGDEVHYNASVFKEWDKRFWSKEISWQYAKRTFGYKWDGWHLAKSAMIFSLVGAIVIFRIHHQWWIHFISFGAIWNGSFNLFYKLFKR